MAFHPGHPLALEQPLKASIKSAQELRDDLHEQVYDALRFVAQGFFSYPTNHLTPTPETCQMIYENSLILLYRLLVRRIIRREILVSDRKGSEGQTFGSTAYPAVKTNGGQEHAVNAREIRRRVGFRLARPACHGEG